MKQPKEQVYPLSAGLNKFAAEAITLQQGQPIPLSRLINLGVDRGCLFAYYGLINASASGQTENPGSGIRAIAGYLSGSNTVELYLIGDRIKKITTVDDGLAYTDIEASGLEDSLPSTAVWDNAVYVASHEIETLELKGLVAAKVDFSALGDPTYNKVKAKHLLAADDRMFYANLLLPEAVQQSNPSLLVWSDLYSSTNFAVGVDNEAGTFQVGNGLLEITGLTEQRGYINVYTPNSIVRAKYVGITAGVYEFTTLYNGIGNLYHYAAITVKELDFFIGRDNFYILDGTQLHQVGDSIWEWWMSIRQDPKNKEVRAFKNERLHEVYWEFEPIDEYKQLGSSIWHLVYNYRANEWSLRDSRGVIGFVLNDFPMDFTYAWSDMEDTWENTNEAWTSYIAEVRVSDLYVTSTDVFRQSGAFGGIEETPVYCLLETQDMLFGSLFAEKYLDTLKLLFEGEGILDGQSVTAGHSIKLQLGVRDSYSEPIQWGEEFNVSDPKQAVYFIRKSRGGKLLRLRLKWYNTSSYFVSKLHGLALRVITPMEDAEDR